MSDRTPEALAAHALRSGLEVFWPDSDHWAKRAFFKPIMNPDGRLSSKARCVSQMISDSLLAVLGGYHAPFGRAKAVAVDAILNVALGSSIGMEEGDLVALNDGQNMTYECMRAYVEAAALELEKAD